MSWNELLRAPGRCPGRPLPRDLTTAQNALEALIWVRLREEAGDTNSDVEDARSRRSPGHSTSGPEGEIEPLEWPVEGSGFPLKCGERRTEERRATGLEGGTGRGRDETQNSNTKREREKLTEGMGHNLVKS